MDEGAIRAVSAEVESVGGGEADLPANPFHAPWFVAAASGRLTPPPGWAEAAGARLPTRPARRLGRLPLPHREGLHHDHCFLGVPDLAPGREAEGLTGLARGASLLRLRAVPEDDPAHAALAGLPGARIVATRERACLRAGLPYEAHLADALRGKKRKELRRQRARLEETGAVTEHVDQDADGLAAWTDAFLALEAEGWKGEAGTAMRERPQEAAFLRDMLAGAGAGGALRRFALRVDGRPAVMVIGLAARDGGLYTYKIAHDPALSRYSPGVMGMLMVTRHVLGTGEGGEGSEGGAAYADSCAAEGHPMIDGLWRERRRLHDWIVPGGAASRAVIEGLTLARLARRP